jgi:hypothetical protein
MQPRLLNRTEKKDECHAAPLNDDRASRIAPVAARRSPDSSARFKILSTRSWRSRSSSSRSPARATSCAARAFASDAGRCALPCRRTDCSVTPRCAAMRRNGCPRTMAVSISSRSGCAQMVHGRGMIVLLPTRRMRPRASRPASFAPLVRSGRRCRMSPSVTRGRDGGSAT